MQKIIILIGLPGSGKGTQGRRIASTYGYGYVVTGELLRALEKEPNLEPRVADALASMKTGNLTPDWLIYDLAFREIEKYLAKGQGVILDGAIRNLEQAKEYQKYFTEHGLTEKDVLAIEVKIDEEESVNRLTRRRVCADCGEIIPWSDDTKDLSACPKCGGELVTRKDDNIDTIQARVKEQGEKVLRPITDFYREAGVLVEVDGMQNIEAVWHGVERALKISNN